MNHIPELPKGDSLLVYERLILILPTFAIWCCTTYSQTNNRTMKSKQSSDPKYYNFSTVEERGGGSVSSSLILST